MTPERPVPSGAVTFLFSDIEGSSQLERRVGTAAYVTLLARHRTVLRTAFAAHDGVEQGTEGDSFFVVFASAAAAVQAAVDAQLGLAAAEWPDGASLRVRIGLHSGEATQTAEGYVGIEINRAARIAAAAHGGQIVASSTTRDLALGSLSAPGPTLVGFLDLGARELRDVGRSHLFQVSGPGLPTDFPPLRAGGAPFDALPAQPTSFIGRSAEVAEVAALLVRTRLLTLTGPGGTGKTRLSLAAATATLDQFPDGAAWAGLSPIADAALVPTAIAQALGIADDGSRDVEDAIVERLASADVLLMLDNFEQVSAAAPVVGRLLAGTSGLRILVTSRSILHLAGEQEYPVPPLAVPETAETADLALLARNEAVALFVERVRAIRPDFVLTPDMAPTIAAICIRLDGLPLAIELAAARMRVLSPTALLDRLEASLTVLSGGARDLPARQQTLRGAIAWSYDLLDPDARTLFRQLGVFAGGWSLEAAEAVCRVDRQSTPDLLDGLSALTEQSLIRSAESPAGEPRFRMLRALREFGLEQLTETGELVAVRDRHLAFVAALAEAAEPQLTGAGSQAWLDRLDLERDNVRVALRWAVESDQIETGLRLAGQLWRFWHRRGHLLEGMSMTQELLRCPAAQRPSAARAKALNGAGGLAYWRNDFALARRLYEEQLSIARELTDRPATAEALYNLGYLAAIPHDLDLAARLFEESKAIYEELGDRRQVAACIVSLGTVAGLRAERSVADNEQVSAAMTEALVLTRALGDYFWTGTALRIRGRALFLLGDLEAARADALEALELFGQSGDPTGVAMTLDDLGAIALATGDPLRALEQAGAASGLRERIAGGAPPSLVENLDYIEPARAALPANEAEAAWSVGRGRSLDEAVTQARSPRPTQGPSG